MVEKNIQLIIALFLIVGAIAFLGTPQPSGNPLSEGSALCVGSNSCPGDPVKTGKSNFRQAPELIGLSGFINTDKSISLAALRGKVVIVDFWTYSCINCIRTIPYLNSWHEKYAGKGLVIIGVHSPEFEFDKNYQNVKSAVEKFNIKYPVVQDNDFATWRSYNNRYWPHKFLIDPQGYIRYDHIGEGGYEETETKIVELLNERDSSLEIENAKTTLDQNTDFSKIRTPELYLGYEFARAPLGNEEGFSPGRIVSYSLPDSFVPNLVYLEGKWENSADYMRLSSPKGKVVLLFSAKNVNIVAGSPTGSKVIPLLERLPLGANEKGTDVYFVDGNFSVDVKGQRLYNVVSLPDYSLKRLELDVEGEGFELYTFTFG